MDAVFKEYAAHGIMAPPSFLIGENLESMRANAIKMMESAALLPAIENASETAAEAFFAANESAGRSVAAHCPVSEGGSRFTGLPLRLVSKHLCRGAR